MKRNPSPVVSRRRLAAELRRAREEAGKTGSEVAKALDWSSSRVSRIEKAQVGIPIEDVEALMRLYGLIDPLRKALLELATESAEKAWWDAHSDFLSEPYLAFIGLEAGATVELNWQISVVPGLLQTPEYTASMLGADMVEELTPGMVRRRTEVRMRRQKLLTAEDPLRLEAVIDESVLHLMYGSREIVRDQFRHLQKMAALPSVSIRVLPFSVPRSSALAQFVVLRYPERKGPLRVLHPDVLYQEASTGESLEDDEDITFRHVRIFGTLAGRALDEGESLRLIAAAAERAG
ncbi:helix-turn-helix domain-containing protein [Nonomuraea sp. NPDC050663]|uniref:helix-turn-helix domain-containing protein n=1 Tax=Nonomuraea sp. NPDC050663 TaxID=3364370 RepID=UPI0037AFCC5B